jgi:hypothetical protein
VPGAPPLPEPFPLLPELLPLAPLLRFFPRWLVPSELVPVLPAPVPGDPVVPDESVPDEPDPGEPAPGAPVDPDEPDPGEPAPAPEPEPLPAPCAKTKEVGVSTDKNIASTIFFIVCMSFRFCCRPQAHCLVGVWSAVILDGTYGRAFGEQAPHEPGPVF